jgi:hypothetical protein
LLGLLLNEVGVAAHLLVLGEHEVVADVHEAGDALQEVGGGRAAHHQPPVVLLGGRLLPGVVQGGMQHRGGCALLRRVVPAVLTSGLSGGVHLAVYSPGGSGGVGGVLLRGTLPAGCLAWLPYVGVLAEGSLDVLAVGVHVVSGCAIVELADVVWPLYELLVH